jgi:hypothetical protein
LLINCNYLELIAEITELNFYDSKLLTIHWIIWIAAAPHKYKLIGRLSSVKICIVMIKLNEEAP